MYHSLDLMENIAIPIIGLCITIALSIAAHLETHRDYSRNVYVMMLSSCTLLLLTELAQMVLSYLPSSSIVVFYTIDMFVFYALLALICYLWTLYSYYWFNGQQPSANMSIGIGAGIFAEILALLINCFTGIIYVVSPEGVYSRGPHFTAYISLCYGYLLAIIIITAIGAIKKYGSEHKRDYAMFVFCFLFPMLGPLAQYAMPSLSLMGVTEALALLIVYVSVQQKAIERNAVERARFQSEYKAYEESIDRLLTQSSNALCVFRLNISADTTIGEGRIPAIFVGSVDSVTVDSLFASIAQLIRYESEQKIFSDTFERQKLLADFDAGKTSFLMEYHRRVENGEVHLIRVIMNMLKNPGNGDIEAIIYSVDIDRQDKEEKAISAIANREYDYIALIDPESGNMRYQYISAASDAAARFDGKGYDNIMSDLVAVIRDPEEPGTEADKVSLAHVISALEHLKEYSYVCDYHALSGETLQKKITYQYLDNQRSVILFLVSDITEETMLERHRSSVLENALKEARHADAMKTEFLSNVSHDMRTPLNAVLGYTNMARECVGKVADIHSHMAASDDGVMLQSAMPNDGVMLQPAMPNDDVLLQSAMPASAPAEGSLDNFNELRGYLDKIDRAGNILLSLINDTLDLSRIETGDIMLKPVPTRYTEFSAKVVSVILPAAKKKNINLIIGDSDAATVPIYADPLRVQEIIMNLLNNAVKFTPENGEIFFGLERLSMDDEMVQDKITVRDTGCGIAPEFLPKIFEPFAQENQSGNNAGSGLGLSIVKKLVDLMGGTISVNSELGHGTEFTVLLSFKRAADAPDESSPDSLSSADGNSQADLSGISIMLAEDNSMNTEIAKAIINAGGMSVTCVANGQEACRIFAESEIGSFDAVLMDIRMPVLDGRSATRRIREMNRPDALTVPIIAMSADAFDDDIRASLDSGMNDHIAKPISPQRLYDALRKWVRIK